MALSRGFVPIGFVLSGLLGLIVYMIGAHYQLPIIPAQDFAKGLWFGVCIGAELMGGLLLIKAKAKAKAGS